MILSLLSKGWTQINADLSITPIPAYLLSFAATPNQDYVIQTTTSLSDPVWQCLAVLPGNSSGLYSYTNVANPNVSKLFYRYRPVTDYGTNESANLALDGASPLSETIGVSNSTQGQYLGLPVLIFDVNAQGGPLHLNSLTVDINASGNGSVNAAYLYQGSIPIASATVVNGVTIFTNISDGQAAAGIPKNTTVPFTIKVDVSGLISQGSQEILTASVPAAGIILYGPIDNSVAVSGSAQGNTITVAGNGPAFSLANGPSITSQIITSGGSENTVALYTATFNVNVTAVGENVVMGNRQSGYPAFYTSSSFIGIAVNNAGLADASVYGTVTVNYPQPDNVTANGNYFTITQNQTVAIPVTYTWTVTNQEANVYSAQLLQINWAMANGNTESTVIPDPQAWTTPAL